jgi:hypothetical protein
MGDRANVQIKNKRTSVFLYTHWEGTELPEKLRQALARRQRWTDAPYLARIIFDAMTEGAHGEETGFGIDSQPMDSNHPELIVDCDAAIVTFGGSPPRSHTFEDYIMVPGAAAWPTAKRGLAGGEP